MAQKYERLVQEDMNVGVNMTWVTAPGRGELRSTQLGIHTVARGQVAYESTWAPGTIAASAAVTTTITVPDAAVGDFVRVTHDKIGATALKPYGHVSAADTVKVVLYNPSGASITPPSGTLSVLVFAASSTAAPDDGDGPPPADPTILEGTVTYDDGLGADPQSGLTVDLRDGNGNTEFTTTTDDDGLYRFTDPAVSWGDGDAYQVFVHAGPGMRDTYDDAHTWAVETTMVVNIAMDGS